MIYVSIVTGTKYKMLFYKSSSRPFAWIILSSAFKIETSSYSLWPLKLIRNTNHIIHVNPRLQSRSTIGIHRPTHLRVFVFPPLSLLVVYVEDDARCIHEDKHKDAYSNGEALQHAQPLVLWRQLGWHDLSRVEWDRAHICNL